MSGSQAIGMILKRKGMSERFRQLLSSKLIPNKYPDKYIFSWKAIAIYRDNLELFDTLKTFEQSGEVKYVETEQYSSCEDSPSLEELVKLEVAHKLQHSETTTLEEFGITIMLSSFQQGLWGDSSELMFEIDIPDSFRYNHYFNHQTRFVLQKMVEILQPKYMWTGYASTSLGVSSQYKYELPFTNTQVFSQELLDEMNVEGSLILEHKDI